MGLYYRRDGSYTLWDSTTAVMEVTTRGLYYRRDGSYTLWDSTSAVMEVTHYGTLLPQ